MTKAIVATRTRSGRISKVPDRLDPLEDLPEDDYSDDDYETESDPGSDDDIDLLQTDDEQMLKFQVNILSGFRFIAI